MLTLFWLSAAQAAEVTYIPQQWRGDISVGYGYEWGRGSFVEPDANPAVEDHTVGLQRFDAHIIRAGGIVTVLPGTALYFEVPTYAVHRYTFSGHNTMVYDPVTDRGSMYAGKPIEEPQVREGAGTAGTWIGLKATPFNEVFTGRGNRSTWLIDLGFRTGYDRHFLLPDGSDLGPGNGASVLKLGMGWSTHYNTNEGYLQATFLAPRDTVVDLKDADGNVTETGATVNNGRSLDVLAGVEVHTYENPETKAWFAVDFRLGYGYQEGSTLPSGIFLPSVMRSTQGTLVDSGEYSRISAGMGLYWQMFRNAKLDIGADVHYLLPHRLEHPYPILTGPDTLEVVGYAKLTLKVRTPKD